MSFLFQFFMWVTSLFLILLVLIQRGRGGGLAGALGGMGGQSAFGTKAGDLFTRITIGVAAFWILLYIVALKVLHVEQAKVAPGMGRAAQQAGDTGANGKDATGKSGAAETKDDKPQDQASTAGSDADDAKSKSTGGAADAATGDGATSNPPAESGDGK